MLHINTRLHLIALQWGYCGGAAISRALIGIGFTSVGYINLLPVALFQEFIDVLAIADALRLSLGKSIDTDMNR